MTTHPPLRDQLRARPSNASWAPESRASRGVRPSTLLDWPKTQLRLLIAGPALLQVLVLASGSIGAAFILRILGAAPLSADGRLALEKVHIVLMIAASLCTFGVGLALALAVRRQLRSFPVAASRPLNDGTFRPLAIALKLVVRRDDTARSVATDELRGSLRSSRPDV